MDGELDGQVMRVFSVWDAEKEYVLSVHPDLLDQGISYQYPSNSGRIEDGVTSHSTKEVRLKLELPQGLRALEDFVTVHVQWPVRKSTRNYPLSYALDLVKEVFVACDIKAPLPVTLCPLVASAYDRAAAFDIYSIGE